MQTDDKQDERVRGILENISRVQGIKRLEDLCGQSRSVWYRWANGQAKPRSKSLRTFQKAVVMFWKEHHKEQDKIKRELSKIPELC